MARSSQTCCAPGGTWSQQAIQCKPKIPTPFRTRRETLCTHSSPFRYGSSCNLVLSTGNGVNGYTLDSALGEFILTHPDMQIPKSRAIYSVNEGNSLYWEDPVKEYINSLKYPQEDGGKPYSARYIGSMVADAYRTLLYGGIFAYPADKKSPKGKLRILYECAPMAMVFENGKSPVVKHLVLERLLT